MTKAATSHLPKPKPKPTLIVARLLSSHLVEGRADEAEALQRLMADRGVEPDEHTAAVLARTQERLSQKRLFLLVRMLKEGEASRHASGLLTLPLPLPLPLPLNPTPTPTPNQSVGAVRRAARARVHGRVPSDRHDAGMPEQQC
mgnify:CR=1 FL=1